MRYIKDEDGAYVTRCPYRCGGVAVGSSGCRSCVEHVGQDRHFDGGNVWCRMEMALEGGGNEKAGIQERAGDTRARNVRYGPSETEKAIRAWRDAIEKYRESYRDGVRAVVDGAV